MSERRVLLVDDDVDLRESLAEALEEEGYRVLRAANGQEALGLLRSEAPPHVILLDLLMPVMNGWQFCEAKRRDPALVAIPVVALSAAVSRDPASPYFIDVEDFVAKPVALPALVEKIAGLLRGRGGP
jgi:CheY-like chemotaxis protein